MFHFARWKTMVIKYTSLVSLSCHCDEYYNHGIQQRLLRRSSVYHGPQGSAVYNRSLCLHVWRYWVSSNCWLEKSFWLSHHDCCQCSFTLLCTANFFEILKNCKSSHITLRKKICVVVCLFVCFVFLFLLLLLFVLFFVCFLSGGRTASFQLTIKLVIWFIPSNDTDVSMFHEVPHNIIKDHNVPRFWHCPGN